MLGLPQRLPYAGHDGATYGTEVAITQVEYEFLYGAIDLDPRMSPGHGSVVALLVGQVLCDLCRMYERTLEVIALHGEDATQASWGGSQRATVVRTRVQSNVVDHIDTGHDGQTIVQEHVAPKDALKVGLARLAVVSAHLEHIAAILAPSDNLLQAADLLGVIEPAVLTIPVVDYPRPRGPSPDAEGLGEEIAGHFLRPSLARHGRQGCLLVGIEACYHRDTRVIGIAI